MTVIKTLGMTQGETNRPRTDYRARNGPTHVEGLLCHRGGIIINQWPNGSDGTSYVNEGRKWN